MCNNYRSRQGLLLIAFMILAGTMTISLTAVMHREYAETRRLRKLLEGVHARVEYEGIGPFGRTVDFMSDWLWCERIVDVVLLHEPLTDEMAELIASQRYLRSLVIAECYSDSAIRSIMTSEKLQLEHLNLGGSNVGDDALRVLATRNSITRLNLDFTHVSDDGLACLRTFPNLSSLSLVGTCVTADGLKELRGLPLDEHYFHGTPAWESRSIEEWQAMFPGVSIGNPILLYPPPEFEALR